MDVYLPIANMSVNGLLLVALGALTGILSGLFRAERRRDRWEDRRIRRDAGDRR